LISKSVLQFTLSFHRSRRRGRASLTQRPIGTQCDIIVDVWARLDLDHTLIDVAENASRGSDNQEEAYDV
jgi:hypothetical protein